MLIPSKEQAITAAPFLDRNTRRDCTCTARGACNSAPGSLSLATGLSLKHHQALLLPGADPQDS